MRRRALVAAAVCVLVAAPPAGAQSPRGQVAGVVTAYVMSTSVIQGLRASYYRVTRVKANANGTGTVWFLFAIEGGKAFRFRASVVCGPVPGTVRACFATRPVALA